MPFIGSVGGSRSGRLFSIGAKPAIPNAASLTSGDATDTFSWSAPNNNGVPITKYGYQTSTNNGSTWSSETETASTSVVLNTQYSLSSYKIRVRAFNAVGWSDYSTASSGTVAWTSNTGTDTETDTACGPAGCTDTETDTDTACGPAGCTDTGSQNCECGTQSRSRTRTSSRTRTRSRTRTSSRTRTRSTQQYVRSGSTSSSITYGSWSAYSDYTYSAWGSWGAYSGYTDYTYSAWGDWSGWSGCSGSPTETYLWSETVWIANRGWYATGSIFGTYWSDASGNANITCAGGSGLVGPSTIYYCNVTGTYTSNAVDSDNCFIVSCC